MDILVSIGRVIVDQILTQTAVIMSVVALIGLILLKKPIEKIIVGVLKTYIGVIMFTLGLNAVQDAVGIFINMVTHIVTGGAGLSADVEVPMNVTLDETNAMGGYMLLIGYVVNILIARFSPFKAIYLTGHWSYWMGTFSAAVLMNYLGLRGFVPIIIGGIIIGLYQSFFPAMVQPWARRITGGQEIGVAHGSTFFVFLAAMLADKTPIGNHSENQHSLEEINLPDRLSFLKETVVTLGFTTIIMYVILALISGKEFMESISGGQNWILYPIFQALLFTGAFMVLLYGVRAFISEITPAFKGISTRLVPGAYPCFDAPVFFQYGNTSVIVGFILSTIGSAIGMVLLMLMNLPVPIMMVNVENFFGGGLISVFANKFGGRRAVFILAPAYGLLTTMARALFFPMITPQLEWGQVAADADQDVVLTLTGWIGKLLGFAQYSW